MFHRVVFTGLHSTQQRHCASIAPGLSSFVVLIMS